MQKKVLRLGFIMGGGVSLGTFSGAALSEAIKQQLVYGQYDTGKQTEQGEPIFAPYDRVELDVFSGASAGAISLAVMIRVLCNPRDKYQFLGYQSYLEMRASLEDKIQKQFADKAIEIKHQFPKKYEQLLAAQTVQDFQEQIWAKEVDVERFLGVGAYHKDLTDNPSFLDRNIIDELGNRIFPFESSNDPLEYKTLLGNRVLFGCTLANLSHTLRSNRGTKIGGKSSSILKALNDSSVDRIHSELRVFDLNFGTIDPNEGRYYPLKWVQFHQSDAAKMKQEDSQNNHYEKTIHSLTDNSAWQMVAATAIASGAFPFAFEPVVLNRFEHEFGADWATELKGKTSHPFTYIDGGIFNNEPIKDAMQLASYIDTVQSEQNFDRQLIFVDPNVTELESQFRIAAHEKLNIGRSVLSGQSKVTKKPTLLRLASKLSHVLSALLNEAQSVEVGRVTEVMAQFERRQSLRKLFRSTIKGTPSDVEIIATRNQIIQALEEKRNQLSLPANILQIQHEFIRICKEEKDFLGAKLPLGDERKLVDQINEFVYVPTPSQVANIESWMFVLTCLSLDVAMGLVAKQTASTLIPIAPFDFYSTGEEYTLLQLPGGSMAGFAGFASYAASAYEVSYGKYCAARILQELSLTAVHNQALPCPPPFDYKEFDEKLKGNLQGAILKRVKEMLPPSMSTVMPFLEGYLSDNVHQFVSKNITDHSPVSSFEFRIQVPNDVLALRGFYEDGRHHSRKNIQPIYLDGEYFMITKLQYDFNKNEWLGDHTNFMQNLYIDKEKLFEDVPKLSIELPAMSKENEAYLSPNPVFRLDARPSLAMGTYAELNAKHWEYLSDVEPLDQHLWTE